MLLLFFSQLFFSSLLFFCFFSHFTCRVNVFVMPCNFSVLDLEACNSKRDRFIYSRIFWPNAREQHSTRKNTRQITHILTNTPISNSSAPIQFLLFFIDFVYGRDFEHMCVLVFLCVFVLFLMFFHWIDLGFFIFSKQMIISESFTWIAHTHTVWLHFKQNSHMLMKTIILFTIMKTTMKIYWNVKSQTISFRFNKTLLNVCKPNFCLFTNQLFLNKNWNSVLTQQKTIFWISFFCLFELRIVKTQIKFYIKMLKFS